MELNPGYHGGGEKDFPHQGQFPEEFPGMQSPRDPPTSGSLTVFSMNHLNPQVTVIPNGHLGLTPDTSSLSFPGPQLLIKELKTWTLQTGRGWRDLRSAAGAATPLSVVSWFTQ